MIYLEEAPNCLKLRRGDGRRAPRGSSCPSTDHKLPRLQVIRVYFGDPTKTSHVQKQAQNFLLQLLSPSSSPAPTRHKCLETTMRSRRLSSTDSICQS